MSVQTIISDQTMINALFFTGTLVLSTGLVTACAGLKSFTKYLFYAGMICQAISLGLRYKVSFPLLPIYQGPFFLPFAAGITGIFLQPVMGNCVENRSGNPRAGCFDSPRAILPQIFLVTLLSWLACLFPNDFYLPFLQFKTLFAHLFFLLGVMGKALFLTAGTLALIVLARAGKPGAPAKSMGRAVLFGFFFWTLSVFSGAIWSWLGWGAPVVWDDPLMATAMAVWLLYALLLHLHLTRFSSVRTRAICFLGGAVFVLSFTCLPELGPFRLPGWSL